VKRVYALGLLAWVAVLACGSCGGKTTQVTATCSAPEGVPVGAGNDHSGTCYASEFQICPGNDAGGFDCRNYCGADQFSLTCGSESLAGNDSPGPDPAWHCGASTAQGGASGGLFPPLGIEVTCCPCVSGLVR
jgi:hypothetical protein